MFDSKPVNEGSVPYSGPFANNADAQIYGPVPPPGASSGDKAEKTDSKNGTASEQAQKESEDKNANTFSIAKVEFEKTPRFK